MKFSILSRVFTGGRGKGSKFPFRKVLWGNITITMQYITITKLILCTTFTILTIKSNKTFVRIEFQLGTVN